MNQLGSGGPPGLENDGGGGEIAEYTARRMAKKKQKNQATCAVSKRCQPSSPLLTLIGPGLVRSEKTYTPTPSVGLCALRTSVVSRVLGTNPLTLRTH